jgi:hypothetical protein
MTQRPSTTATTSKPYSMVILKAWSGNQTVGFSPGPANIIFRTGTIKKAISVEADYG